MDLSGMFDVIPGSIALAASVPLLVGAAVRMRVCGDSREPVISPPIWPDEAADDVQRGVVTMPAVHACP